MKRLFYRLYQFALKVFVLVFPFPRPTLFVGNEGMKDWINHKLEGSHVFIVTDNTIKQLGLLDNIVQALRNHGVQFTIYSDVEPNPSIDNVENGLQQYQINHCDSILAVGGGSVMDCAKLIGARVSRPKKSVRQLKGLFKIIKPLPPLYAIPTTAGTGSETTIVAVVSDRENQQKYAVTDIVLAPKAAILLPQITQGLPPHITATTGMDALTHAIESYLGNNSTPFTRRRSLEAIALILNHLQVAYDDGENIEAREKMLLASFYAGEAFTRASVGYVHAIAHQFGALYNTPHGLANAILLPKVLSQYGTAIESKMKSICQYCQISIPVGQSAAHTLIARIKKMNKDMSIPSHLETLENKDINTIIAMATDEAHPDYPVPSFFEQREFDQVLNDCLLVNK